MKYALLKILILFWQVLMLFPASFHEVLRKMFIHNLVRLFFRRNRYSKINIINCFPKLDEQEVNKIYRKNLFELSNIFLLLGLHGFGQINEFKKIFHMRLMVLINF